MSIQLMTKQETRDEAAWALQDAIDKTEEARNWYLASGDDQSVDDLARPLRDLKTIQAAIGERESRE